VENKVVEVVEALRGAGHPVVEFAWSRKERDSHITKLLAKRESIAARIYDKLRFRVVVKEIQDVLPLLSELLHRLIPFNYVIPDETVNQLLPFAQLLADPPLSKFEPMLQDHLTKDEDFSVQTNEFSGPNYRVINFVSDLPVRIDSFVCNSGD